MFGAIKGSWAVLLGIFFLMIGNGLQSGLLAYRGAQENFSAFGMSFVISAYSAGFLLGSNLAVKLIARVGHVRVFAAFTAFISAAFIVFPLIPNLYVWIAMRIIIGMCFAGVYIVAESWLNSSSENQHRAQVLSAYLYAQMFGIIGAGWLINVAPVAGFDLFVIMSILVSISCAPLLLSNEPAPNFESSTSMKLRELYEASPLGFVTVFLAGAMFALQFGMIGIYAEIKGLGVSQLSIMITAIYVGGLILQYPLGFLSDKYDRRTVIVGMCGSAAVLLLLGLWFTDYFPIVVLMCAIMGGITNPLYSIAIAYLNDRVPHDKMAGVSAGVMIMNGLGAIGAPLLVGYSMQNFTVEMFWIVMIGLFAICALFGIYRSTIRQGVTDDNTKAFAAVSPTASPILMEMAQEQVSENPN